MATKSKYRNFPVDRVFDDFEKTYIWESIDPFEPNPQYRDRDDILSAEALTYPESFGKNVCRIYMKDGYVYSNHSFNTGDIVEICPCDILSDLAYVSNELGDKVFEISKGSRYALPHGYCRYYDVSDDPFAANCDYIWDPNKSQVVIRALKQIPKNTRLVLNIRQKQQSHADRQFSRF